MYGGQGRGSYTHYKSTTEENVYESPTCRIPYHLDTFQNYPVIILSSCPCPFAFVPATLRSLRIILGRSELLELWLLLLACADCIEIWRGRDDDGRGWRERDLVVRWDGSGTGGGEGEVAWRLRKLYRGGDGE